LGLTSPVWDLQGASFELARSAAVEVNPGEVSPNPGYVPPEIASGLGAPGPAVVLRSMRWARPVGGAPGLARIALDVDVLAHARADLGDLRLIDEQDQQLPYVLSSRGAEVSWGELPFTRKEDGRRSLLTVELPHSGVQVASVTARAGGKPGSTPFSRTVTVSRPAGGRLEPVRRFQWDGRARSVLNLGLDARFADRLVLEIENGDNPPVDIEAIEVRWPQWELLAVLPAGGARLVYGDPKLGAPVYDLAQVVGAPSRRPPVATLGPEERLAPPPLATSDRILLGVALAALAAGLAWVLAAAIRAVPEPSDPAPAA
jgi:hypothetical protein